MIAIKSLPGSLYYLELPKKLDLPSSSLFDSFFSRKNFATLNALFKEKLSLRDFNKNDPVSYDLKKLTSHDKIHESTCIQFSKHSSYSHSPAYFITLHSSSFKIP